MASENGYSKEHHESVKFQCFFHDFTNYESISEPDLVGVMDSEEHHESGYESLPEPQSVGIMRVTPKHTRYWRPDLPEEEKPIFGKLFESLDLVYDFYQKYANKGGFIVCKGGENKDKDNSVSRKYFLCAREGVPKDKTPFNSLKDGHKKRRKTYSQRCGCEAKIILKLNNQKVYEVVEFVEEHNHSLVHQKDKHFLKSNRRLNFTQKQALHAMSNINLGPNKGFNILKQTHGGFDKVGATVAESKNFKRKVSAYIGDGDAHMVIEKFSRYKEYLPDFSFEFCQGGESELTGLFWADETAKRNYIAFGDVVGFDGTYRTNEYFMTFIPFTGIDNHNRCVTFGAGLLTKEDADSYIWLLEAFKKTHSREPKFLVTDQCPSTKKAIPLVFKTAKQRLCMWHITDKFTSMVGTTICKAGFLDSINKIIWSKTNSISEFETDWVKIMEQFGLKEHNWLAGIYKIRHQWIPAYFRQFPLGGLMQTTSRCEGENYFFGLLTNANLHLIEFVNHFEIAMEVQRNIQMHNDHESRYKTPLFLSGLPMEIEASQIVSRFAFVVIQTQIMKSMQFCMSYNVIEYTGGKKIFIRDVDDDFKYQGKFEVDFKDDKVTIACTCKLFELEGFLCRHCFFVLRMFKIKEYPKKYILRRWMKDVVPLPSFKYAMNLNLTGDNKEKLQSMLRDANFYVESAVDRLVNDIDKLSIYVEKKKQLMDDVFEDMPFQRPMNDNEVIETLLGASQPEEITIQKPKQSRNKGCGGFKKRLKSAKELAIGKPKKEHRTCNYCGLGPATGHKPHDFRNCDKRKEDLAILNGTKKKNT